MAPPQVLIRAYASSNTPSLPIRALWLDRRPIADQLQAWPHERTAKHQALFALAPVYALGDAAQTMERIHVLRTEIEADPIRWNEVTAALRRVQVTKTLGAPSVLLDFDLSEYVAGRIVGLAFVANGAKQLLTSAKMLPWASQGFGVNVSLLTADNKVLFAVRGHATASGQGLRHCAMNEGMQAADTDADGNPDFLLAIRRGLQEELGIDHDLGITRIQSLFVTDTNQWAVSGLVDLRATHWTESQIRLAHATASDRGEADLFFVDHTAFSIAQALQTGQWIPHGAVTVALAAIDSLGSTVALQMLTAIAPHTSLRNLRATGILAAVPLIPGLSVPLTVKVG
jgi:hypothetical protein